MPQQVIVPQVCAHCRLPIDLDLAPHTGYPLTSDRMPNVYLCPHGGCAKSNVVDLPGRVIGVRPHSMAS